MYDSGHPRSVFCDNLEGWGGEEDKGGFRREGTHVYLWLIYTVIWHKPSQYCNYPPMKVNKKIQNMKKGVSKQNKAEEKKNFPRALLNVSLRPFYEALERSMKECEKHWTGQALKTLFSLCSLCFCVYTWSVGWIASILRAVIIYDTGSVDFILSVERRCYIKICRPGGT